MQFLPTGSFLNTWFPALVVLFWEIVETLEDGTLLVEWLKW
jgi:hypothetical protein